MNLTCGATRVHPLGLSAGTIDFAVWGCASVEISGHAQADEIVGCIRIKSIAVAATQ